MLFSGKLLNVKIRSILCLVSVRYSVTIVLLLSVINLTWVFYPGIAWSGLPTPELGRVVLSAGGGCLAQTEMG